MAQHKWHKEIKAWADGAEIESRCNDEQYWIRNETPAWNPSFQYRIKPQPKEPTYLYGYKNTMGGISFSENNDHFAHYVCKIKIEVDD